MKQENSLISVSENVDLVYCIDFDLVRLVEIAKFRVKFDMSLTHYGNTTKISFCKSPILILTIYMSIAITNCSNWPWIMTISHCIWVRFNQAKVIARGQSRKKQHTKFETTDPRKSKIEIIIIIIIVSEMMMLKNIPTFGRHGAELKVDRNIDGKTTPWKAYTKFDKDERSITIYLIFETILPIVVLK
ncbi:hypothetical protein RFI_02860 [Reticulomyxa filosa]|uniref:Uncharacterized protein n=1 Tax=Reticulomyxa filosa TaxID=46433 RepID=X6P7Z1_RETFI|nr:hypothetical protein RFI_02860 [Reticulomyxa filosa]|eukprot:ETO34233.1 hypothetical protein RFI_02860 [Reticulomyxa filosa]